MRRFAAISSGMVVGLLNAEAPPSLHVPTGMTFVDITDIPAISTVGWRYDSVTGLFTEEDEMTAQKQQFLSAIQRQMTDIGLILDKSQALINAFADRGYDAAASDPITNVDLEDYGVIQFDLGIAINTLQQLQKLFSAQATQPNAAYEAAVSKWRQL